MIRIRLLAPLVIGLAAIALPGFAATPAPATAPSILADAPFWTGNPDAKAFRTLNQKRVALARAEIARLIAVKGPRTVANTLAPYDEASRALDAADNQSSLIEEVHPDSTVRVAAEAVSHCGLWRRTCCASGTRSGTPRRRTSASITWPAG